MDDVFVVGRTKEGHRRRLLEVFRRLNEKDLGLDMKKLHLGVSEFRFAGYTITRDGIKPMEDKVRAITEFEEPKDVSQLRTFLGMVVFVAKYVQNFASTAKSL